MVSKHREHGVRHATAPDRFTARRGPTDAEYPTLGCNVLAVRPRVVVIAAGNPLTAAALRAHGCDVHEYAGAEISVKGDGGPTCLTQPRWRA